MPTKLKDIKWEGQRFWVCDQPKAYTVFQNGTTHSTSVQSFAKTEDGLSLAIAYAQYKDRINHPICELCGKHAVPYSDCLGSIAHDEVD
jgi:hypothetical protein